MGDEIKLRLLTFLAVVLASGHAGAEKRIALVIGTATMARPLGCIPNPSKDAKLMANTLRRVGFHVIESIDVDQKARTANLPASGVLMSEKPAIQSSHSEA